MNTILSMKKIAFVSVFTTGLLSCVAADTFPFKLVFNNGPLDGRSFPGQFSTDSGDGLKAPFDGSLYDFNAVVDGVSFSTNDDYQFPNFPLAEIASGQVVFLDSILDNVNGDGELNLLFEAGSQNRVTFSPSVGAQSLGRLQFPGYSVPDSGSTLALCLLGLAGVMIPRRTKAA